MGRKKKRKSQKKKQEQRRPAPPPVAHDPAPAEPGKPAPKATAPPPTPKRTGSRARPLALVTTAVVVAALASWWIYGSRKAVSPETVQHSELLARAAEAAGYSLDDFAGAESCEECHAEQYEAWLGSTHGKAGGEPNSETVIAPFDGTPMRFADALVTPRIDDEGRYQFIVEQAEKNAEVFTVAGVIGGGFMEGGGTQGFVSDFPDGTIRFLPFDYIKAEDVWFCNTNTRTEQGWIPITRAVSLDECADWPPIRILGTDVTYANCQECHVAQIEVVYDSSTSLFSTRLTTLAIDCESCHGPMAEHVERSQPDRILGEADLDVEALVTTTKDGSLQVCFRCHALKDVMQPGFIPGKPLLDYYSIGLTALGGGDLFPDGRIRTFAYQGNHRYSDCYLNGSMTCVDCHDPHTQEYRDIWGAALEGRFADEQCTDCHPSKLENPEAHTFHEPGTDGSRCIDCHMPYLQHPYLGNELRFSRSDHTIPIPRPGFDDRMGIVNACALSGCHPDSSVTALEEVNRRWYGELKPHKPVVNALVRRDPIDRERAVAVLLDSAAGHPAAQVTAVGEFVQRYLSPDMPRLDVATESALRRLTRVEDLDLRATALAALHLARGNNEDVRRFLNEARQTAETQPGSIVARWATALGTFADTYFGTGEWNSAIVSYRKALELRPGHAATLMNLGLAQAYAGDHDEAVVSLRSSIAEDSRQPLAWVNLGFSLASLGDDAGAEQAYRTAVEIKDDEAMAHFNLGNLLLRQEELTQAIQHYERTLELQPTLLQAHLYLVRAYVATNDVRGAVIAARRWLRYAPDDPRPRQLLEEVGRSMRR